MHGFVNCFLGPWPWYVCGPLIAVVMLLLLYFGKTFGISSNLRTLCTLLGAGGVSPFFNICWRDYLWNLVVVAGAIIGGFIATRYLSNGHGIHLNPKTVVELRHMGFRGVGHGLVPKEVFGFGAMWSVKGLAVLVVGGFLVGFGARYAGGCTSGHAITGLSSLQRPSLIAVMGFFIGGLIMVNFILPLIFTL